MSIAAIEVIQPAALQQTTASAPSSLDSQFDLLISAGLNGVNDALLRTETDAQRLVLGDVQNLHQIMIHMEEAKASFQLLVQVRNRLLDAYQEVMRTQV